MLGEGSPSAICLATFHMLLSPSVWREVNLAMFTVYIDDSGTSPSQKIAIATGLVLPAAQIIRLENEWDSLKTKEGFSDFSMSEFVHNNLKSEFANWDEAKRLRVWSRIRQISKKYGVRAFSVAVNKSDYDEVVPDEIRSYGGKYHYSWAVTNLLAFLDGWRSERPSRNPLEYVFHWMEEPTSKAEIEATMERSEYVAEENGNLGGYLNYSFRKSIGIPGLQCVDAISWVCYQIAQNAITGKGPHKYANIGWQDFGGDVVENGWLKGVTVLRGDLERFVSDFMANPEGKERLQRAQNKRLARFALEGLR